MIRAEVTIGPVEDDEPSLITEEDLAWFREYCRKDRERRGGCPVPVIVDGEGRGPEPLKM